MYQVLLDLLGPITTLATVLVFVGGGHRILTKIEMQKKTREQEVELVRAVREQQYASVTELYSIFQEFMAIYRLSALPWADLGDQKVRAPLVERSIIAEARLDALILRFGAEFASIATPDLARLLGDLRQSGQLWREQLSEGSPLPFYAAEQRDYLRFKAAFAKTAALMVAHIHNRLDYAASDADRSVTLLMAAFSNTHEASDSA